MKRTIPWLHQNWRSGVLVAVPAIAVLVLLVTAAVQIILPIVSPSATMDGLTWQKMRFPTPSYGLLTVVAGGPGFVAAGSDAVWTSVDGSSWSQVPDDDQTSGAFVNAFIDTLVARHGRLYAGGSGRYGEARIWVSSDGIRWKELALPQSPQSLLRVVSIASGPGGLVAVGGSQRDGNAPTLWLSSDGEQWRLVDLAGQGALAPDDLSFGGVAAGAHGYVALLDVRVSTYGAPSRMLVSKDGQRWTRAAPDDEPQPPSSGAYIVNQGPAGFGTGGVTALSADQGGLLAAGLEAVPSGGSLSPSETWIRPVLWRSSDGQRWTATTTQSPLSASPPPLVSQLFGTVNSIVREGSVLWAAGSIGNRAAIWASRDGGHHWSPLPDPHGLFDSADCRDCRPSASITALAVHNGVVVAVGADFWAAVWRGATA